MTPLVLLPGMMCDERLFASQINELSKRREVHFAKITDHETISELASDVLNNAPPVFALAGLSMGGIVAMEIVSQAPERVERLALLDTNPLAELPDVLKRRGPQIDAIKKGHLKNIYKDEWKQRKYSSYPFARRHYLPNNAIVNTELFGEYGGLLGTSAMMQRGCCFKCAFCVYNVPGYIQPKSNQMVEEEIEYLKREYKIQGLNLRDEIAIPLAPKVAAGFLDAIGRTNLKWRGQTKVGASKGKMVTREVLKLAAESG